MLKEKMYSNEAAVVMISHLKIHPSHRPNLQIGASTQRASAPCWMTQIITRAVACCWQKDLSNIIFYLRLWCRLKACEVLPGLEAF